MAITDPRYHIKNIIDAITITKDDGGTNAPILFQYEGGPEDLVDLFFIQNYDMIVTVGTADPETASGDRREIQDEPVHFTSSHKVTVTTVDKYSIIGTQTCTATKLQDKMNNQLKSVLGTNAQQTGYTVKIQNMRPPGGREDRKIGGTYYWIREYRIEYFEINP